MKVGMVWGGAYLTKAPYKLEAKFLMEIQFFMFYTTHSNLGD